MQEREKRGGGGLELMLSILFGRQHSHIPQATKVSSKRACRAIRQIRLI